MRAAGCDATTVQKTRYSIVREQDGQKSMLVIEDETEYAAVVERMRRAGVPIERRDF